MSGRQTVIDKGRGWTIGIRDMGNGRGWRVVVSDEARLRAYVAPESEWMDDYPMAVKWAHCVMRDMQSTVSAVQNSQNR